MKITSKGVKETLESFAQELRETLKVDISCFAIDPASYFLRMFIHSREIKIVDITVARNKNSSELYLRCKFYKVEQNYLPFNLSDLKKFNEKLHEHLFVIEKMVETYKNEIFLYQFIEDGVTKLSLHNFTNRDTKVLRLKECEVSEMINFLIEEKIFDANKIERIYQNLEIYLDVDKIRTILYNLMKLE